MITILGIVYIYKVLYISAPKQEGQDSLGGGCGSIQKILRELLEVQVSLESELSRHVQELDSCVLNR